MVLFSTTFCEEVALILTDLLQTPKHVENKKINKHVTCSTMQRKLSQLYQLYYFTIVRTDILNAHELACCIQTQLLCPADFYESYLFWGFG